MVPDETRERVVEQVFKHGGRRQAVVTLSVLLLGRHEGVEKLRPAEHLSEDLPEEGQALVDLGAVEEHHEMPMSIRATLGCWRCTSKGSVQLTEAIPSRRAAASASTCSATRSLPCRSQSG